MSNYSPNSKITRLVNTLCSPPALKALRATGSLEEMFDRYDEQGLLVLGAWFGQLPNKPMAPVQAEALAYLISRFPPPRAIAGQIMLQSGKEELINSLPYVDIDPIDRTDLLRPILSAIASADDFPIEKHECFLISHIECTANALDYLKACAQGKVKKMRSETNLCTDGLAAQFLSKNKYQALFFEVENSFNILTSPAQERLLALPVFSQLKQHYIWASEELAGSDLLSYINTYCESLPIALRRTRLADIATLNRAEQAPRPLPSLPKM